MYILALLILSFAISFSNAQDLQFGCILCAGKIDATFPVFIVVYAIFDIVFYVLDKLDKCQIDCSLNNIEEPAAIHKGCYDACSTTYKQCKDTPTATACLDCTVACASTYDSSLRTCLSTIERIIVPGMKEYDCEYSAAATMDTCMNSCQEKYK